VADFGDDSGVSVEKIIVCTEVVREQERLGLVTTVITVVE